MRITICPCSPSSAERPSGVSRSISYWGGGHAHAAGLRLHPRECGERERRFGLPETLHQPDARQLLEGVVDGSVQCFSGRGAVFERREVVFREVFADQKAVDRGWGAQRGDAVLFDLVQDVRRRKFLVVVDENIGPGQPLPVQLAPSGLRPSRVGDRQVQAPVVQVVPETPRADMPQRIGEVVRHHFRFARGSRCEVHHHDIVVGVHPLRTHERGGVCDSRVEIEESFGNFRPDAYQQFGRRAFRHGRRHVVGDHPFARRDDRLDSGRVAPVHDVFLGQQVSRRNHDRPQLVQGEDRKPEFVSPFENQHHHVALSDAETLEIGGRAVGLPLHVGERELNLRTLIVCPEQRFPVGLFLRVGVHHVIREVEILRDADMQVLSVILLRAEGRLL